MKKVDYTKCKNVQDHYDTSIKELSKNYVPEYISYLMHIRDYMKTCNSYRELGTNQGASASAALLESPKLIQLIDISFDRFNISKPYFEKYCLEKGTRFEMIEANSLTVKEVLEVTDFLLIDSVHKYKHVLAELELYAPFTEKYIMIHDTVGFPEVGKAVSEFVHNTQEWDISYHYDHEKAGYTVLERI